MKKFLLACGFASLFRLCTINPLPTRFFVQAAFLHK
jgi:hypothetical protein